MTEKKPQTQKTQNPTGTQQQQQQQKRPDDEGQKTRAQADMKTGPQQKKEPGRDR